jgi:hypothetical protein
VFLLAQLLEVRMIGGRPRVARKVKRPDASDKCRLPAEIDAESEITEFECGVVTVLRLSVTASHRPISPISRSFGDLIGEELLHRVIERRAGLRHLERIEIAARHEKPAFLIVHIELRG